MISNPFNPFLSFFLFNRFKEKKMTAIIKEIIFYIFFLNVTMLITMGERDENAYFINKSLEDMFVSSAYHGKMKFDKVSLLTCFVFVIVFVLFVFVSLFCFFLNLYFCSLCHQILL